MKRMPGKQKGGAISTILILAVVAYAIYVGIQYVPVYVESTSVDSILATIRGGQKNQPLRSVHDIEEKVNNLLYLNEMRDMEEHFKVRKYMDSFIIEVSYQRELNLLFDTKVLNIKKSLTLD